VIERWPFAWAHGRGEVQALGGMVGPVSFRLRGQVVQPFAIAPWSDEPQPPEVPGHLRRLRGAFPCLPFGVGAPLLDAAPGWESVGALPMDGPPHGASSNADWTLLARDARGLTLGFDDAAGGLRLYQRLQPDPGAAALTVTLEARSDRAQRLPVGQHYLLRLPPAPARIEIEAGFGFGMTYPGTLTPGVSRTLPGQRFQRLAAVPGLAGPLDLARLKVTPPLEEVVQLCGVTGPVVVRYPDEGWAAQIDWDRALLPSCLIWIGGGGIAEAPWRNRFLGLGVEPIAAAFDLAPAASAGDSPLARAGVATALDFAAGEARTIVSRIELF
jgi:hypothetical protein